MSGRFLLLTMLANWTDSLMLTLLTHFACHTVKLCKHVRSNITTLPKCCCYFFGACSRRSLVAGLLCIQNALDI